MQFQDSETQRLLRNAARSYLAGAYPWERLYRIERGDERVTAESLAAFAGLGWFGLLAPERAGGGGATLLDAAALVEEFGYAAVPAPVAVANIAAWLLSAASGDGVADHLARLARGGRLFTISESTRRAAGDTPLAITGGVVSGTLPLVPFADVSAYVLAPAAIDGEPAFAALPLAGAEIEPVELMDRRCYADVHFRNVRGEGLFVLATGAQAGELHDHCDALATAFSLIELSGMMQRVLEMTRDYIVTRVQFGQPIAKFQAARHRAAELLVQVETTRWAAYHALWRFQQDPGDTDGIWLAKHWAVRAVDRVFQNSHLLHGGVGVGMEYPLHLYTQSIAAFAVRGGAMGEMLTRTLESLRRRPAAGARR